ncbi:MAG: LytTR family DNA-binding domain-containing protein [Chitinophagaceae bacterium]
MSEQPKYNDTKFFLIAIVFINAFNYYLTYSDVRFNWFFIFTFTNDVVQGWLAWWTMRSIIIYLDKKLPYANKPLKRIGIQLLLAIPAGLLVISLLTELTSWLVKGRFAPASFYLIDLFIISVWLLVINGIYICMHYYHEWKQSELLRQEDKKIRAGGYTVKHGKENRLILFQDILGFYAEEGYIVLLTWDNKKYFPDKSLDKIEEALPEELFFRLNRQYIVHRKALAGFKRTGDGKIDVQVNAVENFPKAIQVSRTRAVPFKNWFQPGETGK